jgi:hypothetical protein
VPINLGKSDFIAGSSPRNPGRREARRCPACHGDAMVMRLFRQNWYIAGGCCSAPSCVCYGKKSGVSGEEIGDIRSG